LPEHACFSRDAVSADPGRLDDIPGAESGNWDLYPNYAESGKEGKEKVEG
jgi:hypothetical protein